MAHSNIAMHAFVLLAEQSLTQITFYAHCKQTVKKTTECSHRQMICCISNMLMFCSTDSPATSAPSYMNSAAILDNCNA